MKNLLLAQWLQDHVEMLGDIKDNQDNVFHVALYEGIIDMALNGKTRMVDSLLESGAAHAVAVGRSLTNLLGVPQRLRERIWKRIGEEIDPEPAFVMLSAVDTIFVHVIRVIIDAYLEATQLAHGAKAAEISRLYTDAERKVMEYAAEVSRANRELAKLEQAKTDFISIAAHELKTPLTLIQGYVNILRDVELEDEVAASIERMGRGAERMATLLDDMLDLSAIDMNQLSFVIEPINLKRAVELIIIQMGRALAEREQTVKITDVEALPTIEADARRLHQILKQIINNAIKYTPNGGQIIITGQAIEPTKTEPAYVQIKVQDTGVGIAPEEHEKVFEKFYRVGQSKLHSTGQTKFMGAGPGLGLAIARGLVEAHGGRIWAESQGFDLQNCPGSAFIIRLPVKAAPRPGVNVSWLLESEEVSKINQGDI